MFFNSVVLVQTDADVNAIVRPRQKGENATTTHQKEPEADAVAISFSASLLDLAAIWIVCSKISIDLS